ncbi:hypothetical protein DTO207G8_1893 [Paecilomyces variotii]|nr:hypothetical protein DTO195F2_8174 [Paecilomyces variotii]KAJ9257617.1 hypothetical protein DTO207G8_1893 [Paecilomyces variotii]KAJ9372523.1 hypothetical protein DTO282E5_2850 [Paecilomyces variotii]
MPDPQESAFTFPPLGGIIQEFRVAGHNIVQGFPTQQQYVEVKNPYFGATIGRTCNRIKDGLLKDLNGKTYSLAKNNGPNSLHGGEVGWDKKIFEGPQAVNHNGKEALLFKYLSKDGEEGYPGTVELRVWYMASKEDVDTPTPKTVLVVEYEVEFVGDECEETAVSVTNHSYFNISGGPTIAGTRAQLFTDKYLPVDSTLIPTGKIEKYDAVNVTEPFDLQATEPAIDNCFVMDTDPSNVPLDTRGRPLRRLAQFSHPATGLRLEVESTEPAFQFYTGSGVDVAASEGVPARGPGAGFCVEPSRFIDAVNRPEWKPMVALKKGQIWGAKNLYRAWKQ